MTYEQWRDFKIVIDALFMLSLIILVWIEMLAQRSLSKRIQKLEQERVSTITYRVAPTTEKLIIAGSGGGGGGGGKKQPKGKKSYAKRRKR